MQIRIAFLVFLAVIKLQLTLSAFQLLPTIASLNMLLVEVHLELLLLLQRKSNNFFS